MQGPDAVLDVQVVTESKWDSLGTADQQQVVGHARRDLGAARDAVTGQPLVSRFAGVVVELLDQGVVPDLPPAVLHQRRERLLHARVLVTVKDNAPTGLCELGRIDVGR